MLALTFVALISAGEAVHVRGSPAFTIGASSGSMGDDWAKSTQDSLASFSLVTGPTAMRELEQKRSSGDEKEKEKEEHTDGPISRQISEHDMKVFVDALSPKCARRMKAMLKGEGPAIHTFGGREVNSTTPNCHRLHGAPCDTRAHIEEHSTTTSGRAMKSSVDVSGQSCLPIDCTTEEGDLRSLAGFMRAQAKESLPSPDSNVELHVDCTATGGHKVSLGEEASAAASTASPPAAPAPSTEEHRSFAAPVGLGVPVLLTLLGFSL